LEEFLASLKEHKLVQWTLGYVAVSFALIPVLFVGAVAATTQPAPSAEIKAAMAWVFPLNPPPDPNAPPPDMHQPQHVPGSVRTYTLAQYDDMFGAPDWWPQDHPPMPDIVAYGRKPAWACAYCHLPNGQGRPENAGLAGVPAAYIIEQVKAFRSGERISGRPGYERPQTVHYMPLEARHVSDADLQLAAEYFSKLKFKPWTRIIEAATVPKTHVAHHILVPTANAGSEPIGDRIIEISTDIERTELGDARFGFIAYVPPGSIERGGRLATRGEGTTQPCVACHGADLHGVGAIPPLAGRSPTYIVRQLILFQLGRRSNAAAQPMRLEASPLTLRDMIAVAAYAASRDP
jgi:cytochrome c553